MPENSAIFANSLIYSIGFCVKDPHQDADKNSKMCYIERSLGDKTAKSWPLNLFFGFERTYTKCTGGVAHRHTSMCLCICVSFVYSTKEPKITIEIVRFLIGFNSQQR